MTQSNSIEISYKVPLGNNPIESMREFSFESERQIRESLNTTTLNLMLSKAKDLVSVFSDIEEPEGYTQAFETIQNRNAAIKRFGSENDYINTLPPKFRDEILREYGEAEKIVSSAKDWSEKLNGLEFLMSIIGSRVEDSHKIIFPFIESNGKIVSGYVIEKLMGDINHEFEKIEVNKTESLLYIPTGKSYAGLIGGLQKGFKKSDLLSKLNPSILYVSNGLKCTPLGEAYTRKKIVKRNKESDAG
ncbi:MAG: hypothetical protein KC550_01170 [Nanoarchaeota archaeon]|nr:hypothetical protein [Nanoarchaeota archaeon]